MRAVLFVFVLLLAGCGKDTDAGSDPKAPAGAAASSVVTFAGPGRDRLCLKEGEGRVGLITYAGKGDANCALRGSLTGENLIKPDGEGGCGILYKRDGDRIVLNGGGYSCRYYCGPGATLEHKTFVRMDKPGQVTDLAGDPLC